jgi:hypothetical protein
VQHQVCNALVWSLGGACNGGVRVGIMRKQTHLIAVLVVVLEHGRHSASQTVVVTSASNRSCTVWHRFVISRHADLCSKVMRCFDDNSGCCVSDPAYNWAHVKVTALSKPPSRCVCHDPLRVFCLLLRF